MRLSPIHPTASHVLGMTANVDARNDYGGHTRDVIALDVDAEDGKCFRLLSDLRADFGGVKRELRAGFRWNGADIPRLWQWMLGVDRYDPRVAIASAFHDDECNKANARRGLRVIGDAIFVSLLMPIAYNGQELDGVGITRAFYLYLGVRTYSLWRFVRRAVAARLSGGRYLLLPWAVATVAVCAAFASCESPRHEPTPAAQYDDGLHSVLVRPAK